MGKRVWTKEEIERKILSSNVWTDRAVKALHSEQFRDPGHFPTEDKVFLEAMSNLIVRLGFLPRQHRVEARARLQRYLDKLVYLANKSNY